MSPVRNTPLQRFLRIEGWSEARVTRLAGDASNRQYLRLSLEGRRAILMDAPPERGEDVHPFAAMTHWLREHDYSAPQILGADYANGFLLLEDLGDDLFSRHVTRRPDDETLLYERAVDLLVDLSRRPLPRHIGIAPFTMTVPPYNDVVLEREAILMLEWWIPAIRGDAAKPHQRESFREILKTALAKVAGAREVVVLRDYHADNLVWLPERGGVASVGLLDYQDALAGHPAYDLVSLLEDARRDTSPELREAMMEHYLNQRPELDADAFRAAYAALGAQRNLKIIGIFARLTIRDGKASYLQMIPRVWRHLMNDLKHPSLSDLRGWVMEHVPMPENLDLPALRARSSS